MAKVVVHAGDWPKGKGDYMWGSIQLPIAGSWKKDLISVSELATVELATEDSVKRVGGTVGWGAAGAVLLGPVGLLAGLLLGGRGKDITFVATFKDGRKLLATTDSKTFTKLQAAVF